jgi:hypothetical protein
MDRSGSPLPGTSGNEVRRRRRIPQEAIRASIRSTRASKYRRIVIDSSDEGEVDDDVQIAATQ